MYQLQSTMGCLLETCSKVFLRSKVQQILRITSWDYRVLPYRLTSTTFTGSFGIFFNRVLLHVCLDPTASTCIKCRVFIVCHTYREVSDVLSIALQQVRQEQQWANLWGLLCYFFEISTWVWAWIAGSSIEGRHFFAVFPISMDWHSPEREQKPPLHHKAPQH